MIFPTSTILLGSLITLLLIGEVVLLLLWRKERKNFIRLFGQTAGKEIHELLAQAAEERGDIQKYISDLQNVLRETSSIAVKSVHKISLVRYNPFKSIGGEQSFALALLDANNDGVVLTSLYNSQNSQIYAKPIKGGVSQIPLSPEEERALQEAQRNFS